MKRATKFDVSPSWKLLLGDMNIDVSLVLAYAKLPADLFRRENASLNPDQYFQFMQAIEQVGEGVEVPLVLAKAISVEAFDAPIFAAICSPDLNTALHRIKQYKPLIDPMEMHIDETASYTSLKISCYGYEGTLPKSLELCELVFFTQLARLDTRTEVKATLIKVSELPDDMVAYQEYFGCELQLGEGAEVHFSAFDARRPFATANVPMWGYFEAGLNQKLAELDADTSTAERVKSALIELLPAGFSSIEDVASTLAVSKRTLQRKLQSESVSYHSVLQSVREDLAKHYLLQSKLSLGEISFLLGYQEPNSFIRAYTSWAGVSLLEYRKQSA